MENQWKFKVGDKDVTDTFLSWNTHPSSAARRHRFAPECASEGRRVAVVGKHDLTTTEQVGIQRQRAGTEKDECAATSARDRAPGRSRKRPAAGMIESACRHLDRVDQRINAPHASGNDQVESYGRLALGGVANGTAPGVDCCATKSLRRPECISWTRPDGTSNAWRRHHPRGSRARGHASEPDPNY